MKKFLAATIAAAFTLSVVSVAVAAPAQVNQRHGQTTEIQASAPSDQATTKKSTKKKAAKKTAKKKKQAAKKQAA